MVKAHVDPSAKFKPRFFEDSPEDKAEFLMESDTGNILTGNDGHNGVVREALCLLDKGTQKLVSDVLPAKLPADVDRVGHRVLVPFPVRVRTQARPGDDKATFFSNKEGVTFIVACKPSHLVLEGSRIQVECGDGSEDCLVVDFGNGRKVLLICSPDDKELFLHGFHIVAKSLV